MPDFKVLKYRPWGDPEDIILVRPDRIDAIVLQQSRRTPLVSLCINGETLSVDGTLDEVLKQLELTAEPLQDK